MGPRVGLDGRGNGPVTIVYEDGWALGSVWTGVEMACNHCLRGWMGARAGLDGCGNGPVTIAYEDGWALGSVWTAVEMAL